MASSTDNFIKIKEQQEVARYGLPMPETIYIYNFDKQEKEIDEFLKNKEFVTIRSDKKTEHDFCPHDLKCPKNKAKPLIKKLISEKYAIILQQYIPIEKDRTSGNILILKKYIVVELMGEGPLIWLTRDGRVDEWAVFEKKDLKETNHVGKRIISSNDLKKILKRVADLPPYKLLEFTLRPEGLYFWQIKNDKSAAQIEDYVDSLNEYQKIKGMTDIQSYGLPLPKTIFIYDYLKQKKEIDEFLKDRKYVAVMSDKKNGIYFCPHDLKCPVKRAKKLIEELIDDNFAVILQEQNRDPYKNRGQISGNLLTLKNELLFELMEGEPLVLLNRDGVLDESIKVDRKTLKELYHFGKRIIKRSDLKELVKKVNHLPPYKLLEFTLRPEGLVCWFLRDDETAREIEVKN
jgi:hypothetical protein